MNHSYLTRSKHGLKRPFMQTIQSTTSASSSSEIDINTNWIYDKRYRNGVWKWSCKCRGKNWRDDNNNRSWVCDDAACNYCECEIDINTNWIYDKRYRNGVWKWSCKCRGKNWRDDNNKCRACNYCECEICLRCEGFDDTYIEKLVNEEQNFYCKKCRRIRNMDKNNTNVNKKKKKKKKK
eukprot:458412_1